MKNETSKDSNKGSGMDASSKAREVENEETKDENKSKMKDSDGDYDGDEGVVIPEEFQQAVHGVIKQASTKHHLSHIRERVYAKEDEMRKEEQSKEKKDSPKGGVSEYSSESMPSMD